MICPLRFFLTYIYSHHVRLERDWHRGGFSYYPSSKDWLEGCCSSEGSVILNLQTVTFSSHDHETDAASFFTITTLSTAHFSPHPTSPPSIMANPSPLREMLGLICMALIFPKVRRYRRPQTPQAFDFYNGFSGDKREHETLKEDVCFGRVSNYGGKA